MSCELCGALAPTVYVEMSHNVGLLIVRQTNTTQAQVCRACLGSVFWHHTLRNVTLGWWGVISFFLTWYYLAANLTTYLSAAGELSRAAPAAPKVEKQRPVANPELRLEPFGHTIRMRLESGDTNEEIAQDMAEVAEVSMDQALAFVRGIDASG